MPLSLAPLGAEQIVRRVSSSGEARSHLEDLGFVPGAPVAVVTYTFTNNSEKATSFAVALRPQAFQDGVELNTAIGSDWDSEKYMKDVKPGSSSTVEIGYNLEGESDVTVEVTELFSFDEMLLAEQTFSLK